ncbi:hypothetical protein WJX72_002496 [[Myrmecia] bisecta]|uniref:Uncharacterized protein n=1 Tax=[Myrmecia] bisecta TaxID=41462 RepID=A0AAW1PA72_9CHLO
MAAACAKMHFTPPPHRGSWSTAVGRGSSSAYFRGTPVATPSVRLARPQVARKPLFAYTPTFEASDTGEPSVPEHPSASPFSIPVQGRVYTRKRPKCEQASCSALAHFNDPGAICGRFCAAHREQGMINVVAKHFDGSLSVEHCDSFFFSRC